MHRSAKRQLEPLTYEDWVDLENGDRVALRRPGRPTELATVNGIADDARFFWMRPDGQERRLIFEGDEIEVFRLNA